MKKLHGFSLIEVLVALVVLSIGLIGIAALFVNGLQFSGSAILRTRAINFAEDMADRIRANSVAGASYVVAEDGTGSNKNCAKVPGGTVTSCTSADLALTDVFLWKTALADAAIGLPAGKASITRDTTTTPPTYTVTVKWTERDETSTYVMSFQTP